jgi:SM-20-related protein
MEPKVRDWPDLFITRHFFDEETCIRLVADLGLAKGEAATVYGRTVSGTVDSVTRRTLRLEPSADSVRLVNDELQKLKPAVAEHFQVPLHELEEPQFLRYREGDFFVAHQDGNTGLLKLETERRKISVVIFLSRESEIPGADSFCGGSLVFTDLQMRFEKFRCPAVPGTAVAFPSETTHEVTPVTHGERLSIASWYW